MIDRQVRPRKTYRPILTWAESMGIPSAGWVEVAWTTTYQDKNYHVQVSLRHKRKNTNGLCYIDFYLVTDTGRQEPIDEGRSWYNIRNFDPQRYKAEALAWAESMLLTPMSHLNVIVSVAPNHAPDSSTEHVSGR